MRQLDREIVESQNELYRLSYVNSQIQLNELAGLDEHINELMKLVSETQMLEKQLKKTEKNLSDRYTIK